jgi:diguanylate cyclase (GGDEF)-like protein
VLKEAARALQETVRDIDLAGRWGGEEFVVGLPGTDLAGGARLAERIRATLAERPIEAPSGEHFRVTATFGVAEFDGRGGLLELLAAADAASTAQNEPARTVSQPLQALRRNRPSAWLAWAAERLCVTIPR